jgi:chemotaxis family two-component system response regulator Rcp1
MDRCMFRILVVDDDRAAAYSLREVMKNLHSRPELHFVSDGVEALDFLHRRGAYEGAPRPDLILLDVNMPRLGGLETLSAIKSDPQLYVIPVIMLSASTSLEDIRESYQARANCYVQKPTDLDRSVKFVQAIETFWRDFALLPARDDRTWGPRHAADSKRHTTIRNQLPDSGKPLAPASAEARNQAMHHDSPNRKIARPRRTSGCAQHNQLLDDFGVAVRELLNLHEQQFLAIVDEDSECTRFDLLIHMANEQKQRAKYAYLRHVEAHGCSNHDDIK